MRTWIYPAVIAHSDEGDYVVRFPDFPQAITGADTFEEAAALAEDALEVIVLEYLSGGRIIPEPRPAAEGEIRVALDPVTATRAALAQIMRERKITNVALAARLGKSEGAIRRLTDGSANVKMATVIDALKSLGGKAILSDEAA